MKEKILIVDDVDTISRVYARFLESKGYDVQIAFNGEEALAIWEVFKPDLVISDIRMPKMSGFELANAIRKKNPKQKIILMTGYADEAEVLEQQKSHGFPFFTKPVDLYETVLPIVRETLLMSDEKIQIDNYERRIYLLIGENLRLKNKIKKISKGKTVENNIFEIDKYKAICGSLAHSLKGEFQNIGSSVQLIKELDEIPSDITEECDLISRSISYSHIILQRLLNYLDIGKPRVKLINVSKLLDNIVIMIKPRLPDSIELKVEISTNVKKINIYADFDQLMGIIIELIKNATNVLLEDGGIIKIKVNKKRDKIIISVADNGPGIPKNLQNKIFEKQAQSKSGLGLGLFLSQKVINTLGGKIDFKTLKKGTVFNISLPIVQK